MCKVKIKYLSDKIGKEVNPPFYATEGSAGLDLSACCEEEITLAPGERRGIPTGVAIQLPDGYGGFVFARSGLASRHGIAMSNGVGVIDSDYTGELICLLCNNSDEPYTIRCGDRIAQLVVLPVAHASLQVVEEFDQTARADGGFGSTGR